MSRDRHLRCCSIQRRPDFAQVLVRVGLHGLWKLVENIQRLVQPGGLVTRRREGVVESFPEVDHATAAGDFLARWRDQQATRLQIDEQFLPTLGRSPARPSGNRSTLSSPRASRQSPMLVKLSGLVFGFNAHRSKIGADVNRIRDKEKADDSVATTRRDNDGECHRQYRGQSHARSSR